MGLIIKSTTIALKYLFLIYFSYLLVGMVIWVNVIVKFLMFIILLVTKFTVKICLQILQSFGNSVLLLSIVLKHNISRKHIISFPGNFLCLNRFQYDQQLELETGWNTNKKISKTNLKKNELKKQAIHRWSQYKWKI